MPAPALSSVAVQDAPAIHKWVGRAGVVLALALSVMVWSAFWVAQALDARAQTQRVAQQVLEVDLWARLLSARLEASQRLLAVVAQRLDSSLLQEHDIRSILKVHEGVALSQFESMHVALPSGAVNQYRLATQAKDLGVDGVSALRRTLAEGKPTVMALPYQLGDSQHLHVLFATPVRQAQGQVAAVLAATVKYPLGMLLPDVLTQVAGAQHLLLDRSGMVLVHADSAQRWRSLQEVKLDQHLLQTLLQPPSNHAESVLRDTQLLTRIGLPLPQWQAVLVRDVAPVTPRWFEALSWRTWGSMVGGVLLLAWLVSWWGRRVQRINAGSEAQPARDQEGLHVPEKKSSDLPTDVRLTQASAVLGMLPSALLLHVQGSTVLMTTQASVLLGYCTSERTSLTVQELLMHPATYAQVQQMLKDMGSFEGVVDMRKKDGDALRVQLSAWVTEGDDAACLWRLQLPWRLRPSVALPDAEQAPRDVLTGLHRHEAFLWGMQSWVAASMLALQAKTGAAFDQMPPQGCMLFADVDHLGMLNESAGREFGNLVLVHVARLMTAHLQPLCEVARQGGDEFVAMLPGVSLAHAHSIAQALCDAVWHWQPSWHGERYWVSISVGVVAVDAQRHAPEDALRAADMACYEAKRRGRCQVAVGQIAAHPPIPTGNA